MPTIPYAKTTHSDGQSWTAAKANQLENGINDVSYAPAVRVYHNAAQSITTSGTPQALAFNSERYDQAGNAADTQHDTSTNNSRLTCRYAGVYSISGTAEFASNSTGFRSLLIRVNGTTFIANQSTAALSGVATPLAVETKYSLAVNDYVELVANQTSGGALNVNSSGNYSPEFAMSRVG